MPYSSLTYDLLPYDLLYFIILHLPVQQTHGYGVHHGHRHVGLTTHNSGGTSEGSQQSERTAMTAHHCSRRRSNMSCIEFQRVLQNWISSWSFSSKWACFLLRATVATMLWWKWTHQSRACTNQLAHRIGLQSIVNCQLQGMGKTQHQLPPQQVPVSHPHVGRVIVDTCDNFVFQSPLTSCISQECCQVFSNVPSSSAVVWST